MKYSEIKEKLKLNILRENSDYFAGLTHYLQETGNNISGNYTKYANNANIPFLKELIYQGKLNLVFDVPFPPVSNSKFTFIDLFAGIGGFRIAAQNINGKCVFSSEIDKYAKITYEMNFGEIPFGDITKINEKDIPKHDVLCAGFPCQAFSIAGYRKGFEDKTKGTLFFDIARILAEKKPKAFLLENVKNLRSHNEGRTLNIIYETLNSIGYYVTDTILNTMEYSNIPQNRERIYIIGFKSKKALDYFSFPSKVQLDNTIYSCMENAKVDDKYYYNSKPLFENLINDVTKRETVYQWRRKYVRENKNNVCPTLTANMGTGGHNVPIILDDYGIRKLTPRECANFQGYPKKYIFPKIADSQLYKQIGNSVSVPVIERIVKQMKKAMEV